MLCKILVNKCLGHTETNPFMSPLVKYLGFMQIIRHFYYWTCKVDIHFVFVRPAIIHSIFHLSSIILISFISK